MFASVTGGAREEFLRRGDAACGALHPSAPAVENRTETIPELQVQRMANQ